MNKVFLNSFFFCFFFVLISPVLLAQATEKSLLEAWETKQKNDPKTVLFEKLEENRYRFKTKRFAFDGELKIFSIYIDKWEREGDKDVIWGLLEVELVDTPEDFLKKYTYSHHRYSRWRSNNRLFFDKEIQKWVSHKEYMSKRRKKDYKAPWISFWYLLSLFSYMVLLFIFIIIINLLRKIRRNNEQTVQKTLVFYQETNRLLKEILDELKKK